MRDDDDFFVVVALCQLGYGSNGARRKLMQGFSLTLAGRKACMRITCLPLREGMWKMAVNFVIQQAFKRTVTALAQTGIDADCDRMTVGHRLCGIACALQITGINCCGLFWGEGMGKCARLTVTKLIESNIQMPLQAPHTVPVSLAVADQNNVGHGVCRLRNTVGFNEYKPVTLACAKICPAIAARTCGPLKCPCTSRRGTLSA